MEYAGFMEIKTYSRRPKRVTAVQRLQMVEQFRRSGLTRAAFSRQYGISLATLGWWLTKTKRASNLPAPVKFSEVKLITAADAAADGWAMELVGSSGVTLRCREPLAVQDLKLLLRDPSC